MCRTPFRSSEGPNGPTERAQIKSYLMEMGITVDGGGHLLRTNMLLLCCGMRKKLSFALIRLERPKISGRTQIHDSSTQKRNAKNSSVPFRPVPQGRIELRHAPTIG